MRIGFDLDEVFAGFFESFIKYHNCHHGSNLRKDMIKHYDLSKPLGINHDLLNVRVESFYNSSEFKDIQPIEGAAESLPKLKHGNELFIITGRPKRFEESTMNWIERYFPKTFEEVHFSAYQSIYPNEMNKGEYCKKLGLKFFTEDSLDYAVQCAEKGTRVLLFSTPWNTCGNEFERKHGFIRVFSWKDIPDTIKMFSPFCK